MFSIIAQPQQSYRLGDFIRDNLKEKKWREFRASVAFAKTSGTAYIVDDLEQFSKQNKVRFTAGVDHGGTSFEALTQILNAILPNGELWIYKNTRNTFHPKVYLFKNNTEADILIGSGNLTKGGLYENSELGLRLKLDLSINGNLALLNQVEAALDNWSVSQPGLCLLADSALLQSLRHSGDLPTEADSAAAASVAKNILKVKGVTTTSIFKATPIPTAPSIPAAIKVAAPLYSAKQVASPPTPASANAMQPQSPKAGSTMPVTFGMTLQNTDVGVGQTTSGTSKRSPEIFVPLIAMDLMPSFWGWINPYTPNAKLYKPDTQWRTNNLPWIHAHSSRQRPVDKFDWYNVQISLKGSLGLIVARFWYNPKKLDIRMRDNALRSAGSVGDILLIRQAPPGALYHYDMEVIPQNDPLFAQTLSKLSNKVRNSQKVFGYF